MATSEHREIERTYEVPPGATVPALLGVPGVHAVAAPVVHELRATYFDTADLRLAAQHVTLRRRTGGDDAGWHVKLPVSTDERTELRRPLGRATRTVPADVLAPVRVHVRDQRVVPVATIANHRVVHRLLGVDGVVLAEVCDDTVTAEALGNQPGLTRWREWEVELVDGGPELLDAVAQRLAGAGATPFGQPVQARARPGLPAPATGPDPAPGAPALPAGDAVLAALRAQVRALWAWEPRVREDGPDAVHQLRVTVRTLRSLLATYRPVLDRTVTDPVRAELRWFGGVLGVARDAEVAAGLVRALLDDEPPGLVLGPVAERFGTTLGAAHEDALRQVRTTLDGARWFRLLDALDELLADPPFTPAAAGRADEVLPRCVHRDAKRLRHSVTRVDGATSPQVRTELRHEVRKAARRLRHAASSAVPVVGRAARRTARDATAVQSALGVLQDAALTRRVVRDVAAQAHAAGEQTFTHGRLDALAQARADGVDAAFAQAWARLDRGRNRRWLRG